MQISLSIEERPPVLRGFLEELQHALGTDARVWASIVAGDEDAPQQIDAFVQVFEAPTEDAALTRVQPAIREADPQMKIVKSETAAPGGLATPTESDSRADRRCMQEEEPAPSQADRVGAVERDRQQQFQLL